MQMMVLLKYEMKQCISDRCSSHFLDRFPATRMESADSLVIELNLSSRYVTFEKVEFILFQYVQIEIEQPEKLHSLTLNAVGNLWLTDFPVGLKYYKPP